MSSINSVVGAPHHAQQQRARRWQPSRHLRPKRGGRRPVVQAVEPARRKCHPPASPARARRSGRRASRLLRLVVARFAGKLRAAIVFGFVVVAVGVSHGGSPFVQGGQASVDRRRRAGAGSRCPWFDQRCGLLSPQEAPVCSARQAGAFVCGGRRPLSGLLPPIAPPAGPRAVGGNSMSLRRKSAGHRAT